MSDFITSFLDHTEGAPTPDIYRLWAAISTVAGALERRVWVETARSALFPNLYVMLVGAPGVGKDMAINPVRELWQETHSLHIAPVNMSKAGLVDTLIEAERKFVLPDQLVEYHSLLVVIPELGVLLPAHDLEFLSNLNHIYDNPKVYRERKRGIGKEIQVSKPQLNILAGTQPGYMAELFPESAYSMGFISRMIMIYAAEGPQVSLFEALEERPLAPLVNQLKSFTKLMGKFEWSDEAKAEAERWLKTKCEPIPEHSKLQHYIPRRILHTLKLSMIAAVSRTGALRIELEDFCRARDWLIEAETHMPDIFREMLQKSDKDIITELHFFVWSQQIKNKGLALPEAALVNFLQQRVPSEKIVRVLEVAERASILMRTISPDGPQGPGKFWKARPKHEHGVE